MIDVVSLLNQKSGAEWKLCNGNLEQEFGNEEDEGNYEEGDENENDRYEQEGEHEGNEEGNGDGEDEEMQVEPNEEDDIPESGDGTSDGTYGYHFSSFPLRLAFYFAIFFFTYSTIIH